MPDNTNTPLDQLLDKLTSRFAAAAPPPPDAIDAVLAAPPRTSQVASLRNDPVINAFRNELADGLIRADTAHQLIALLSTALDKLPLPIP